MNFYAAHKCEHRGDENVKPNFDDLQKLEAEVIVGSDYLPCSQHISHMSLSVILYTPVQ